MGCNHSTTNVFQPTVYEGSNGRIIACFRESQAIVSHYYKICFPAKNQALSPNEPINNAGILRFIAPHTARLPKPIATATKIRARISAWASSPTTYHTPFLFHVPNRDDVHTISLNTEINKSQKISRTGQIFYHVLAHSPFLTVLREIEQEFLPSFLFSSHPIQSNNGQMTNYFIQYSCPIFVSVKKIMSYLFLSLFKFNLINKYHNVVTIVTKWGTYPLKEIVLNLFLFTFSNGIVPLPINRRKKEKLHIRLHTTNRRKYRKNWWRDEKIYTDIYTDNGEKRTEKKERNIIWGNSLWQQTNKEIPEWGQEFLNNKQNLSLSLFSHIYIFPDNIFSFANNNGSYIATSPQERGYKTKPLLSNSKFMGWYERGIIAYNLILKVQKISIQTGLWGWGYQISR